MLALQAKTQAHQSKINKKATRNFIRVAFLSMKQQYRQ
jgi:hypothetical protein